MGRYRDIGRQRESETERQVSRTLGRARSSTYDRPKVMAQQNNADREAERISCIY